MQDAAGLAETRLTALRFRYEEPWRHYHVWAHVQALFSQLIRVKSMLHDKQAVALAVLYHDAVYDPRSAWNERYSAELMTSECTAFVDAGTIGAARAMILATETHALPQGLNANQTWDMTLFLDADLSILGAAPEAFDAYEAGIRKEYAHVPEAEYCRGRAAILRGFLERPSLYFSEPFRDAYETPARNNLRRSLRRLA